MGMQQSKEELLYQLVKHGNIEGIKAFRTQGVGLEWIDSEGKTPLILACMDPKLYGVAKTLVELGAYVNAYRPGRHAGTPLHHAAERGLGRTVELLLSHGANALLMNDDSQTPLDVARAKGYSNVVRGIEGHVCLFSGWLREFYGPAFLERLAPQLLSKKVWVVVIPCGSRNLREPFKLELAIYAGAQAAQPRTIVSLWKANVEEPNFNQSDPAAIISDVSISARIKLAPVQESENQQLQWFCNACKGIPQVMAINASPQSASHERPPHTDSYVVSRVDSSTSSTNSKNGSSHDESCITGESTSDKVSGSKCEIHEAGSSGGPAQHFQSQNSIPSVVQATLANPSLVSIPSAPPVADAAIDNGLIHSPSVDMSPVDLSSPTLGAISSTYEMKEDSAAASSCTICLDAPLEGACIPCGHMVGCMSCLNEIKAKKSGCPVCRAMIDQVIRIYSV